MATGKIKFFNRKKGFGFIVEDDSQQDIFVHITGFVDRKDPIKTNDQVVFEVTDNTVGKQAIEVLKVNPN